MKARRIPITEYLWSGSGRRLSLIGERLGWDFLIYNPLVMLKFHQQGKMDAPKVAAALIHCFPAASRFLDVGSGTGTLAAALIRSGRNAVACERSRVGRYIAKRQGVDCRPFDLLKTPPAEIPGHVEVVSCFEVAEHLPAPLGDKLVEFLSGFRVPVVFTAAQPGQGGTGHINEQPKPYWIKRFENNGLGCDSSLTEELRSELLRREASRWFSNNVCVFKPCQSARANAGKRQ